jgi:hypothetical protein
MRAHRQWQTFAIDNGHDLDALPRLVGPISSSPPFAAANVAGGRRVEFILRRDRRRVVHHVAIDGRGYQLTR